MSEANILKDKLTEVFTTAKFGFLTGVSPKAVHLEYKTEDEMVSDTFDLRKLGYGVAVQKESNRILVSLQ